MKPAYRLWLCASCVLVLGIWGCPQPDDQGIGQPGDDDDAIGDDDAADDDAADDDAADDDAADDDAADDDAADDDDLGYITQGVGEIIYYKMCESNGATLVDDLDIDLPQDITDFCDAGYAIVDGDVTIDNTRMLNLDGLECLCQVNGDLEITSNDVLYDIDGLTGVKYIFGSFEISSDSGMIDADGMLSLRYVGDDFTIYNVSSIGGPTDGPLAGFNDLIAVGGSFTIETTSSIVHITGFTALESVAIDFVLHNNSALADVSGFVSLDNVGADVEITSNPALPGADAQALADSIATVGGTISVTNNGP